MVETLCMCTSVSTRGYCDISGLIPGRDTKKIYAAEFYGAHLAYCKETE